MSEYNFLYKEIPYPLLAEVGLTQEMIDDLPVDVLAMIQMGRCSPVLPIEIKDDGGHAVKARAKFSLVQTMDSRTDVVFHPILDHKGKFVCIMEKDEKTGQEVPRLADGYALYSAETMEMLDAGKVALGHVTGKEGNKVKAFLQLDPDTREVISIPTAAIGRNLQILARELDLTAPETNCLQAGEVLCLAQGDELISVGLDLNALTGIRIERGDERLWREHAARKWEKYSVGLFGCWKMENGCLSYIYEEDYTEEIWEDIERQREFCQNETMATKTNR